MILIGNVKTNKTVNKRPAFNQINIEQAKQILQQPAQDAWDFLKGKGWISDNEIPSCNFDNINGVWQDQPAFVVAGGSALKYFIEKVGFDFLDGKHTIGINHLIEDYDNFEWFFFLDRRFLEKTTYNLSNFKGRVFSRNTAGYRGKETDCVFQTIGEFPSETIQEGLFSHNLSGLAALNLALITGANPVYLLGYGHEAGTTCKGYHYKATYPGENKDEKTFFKFKDVNKYFNRFEKYKSRIVHVTDNNDIPVFNKMKLSEFKRKFMVSKVQKDIPEIIHFSFSDKISDHADITRGVINKCFGNHRLVSIKDGIIPAADLYILEHFLSTDKFVQSFPYKHKVLNIVHTVNCVPPAGFKKNIALTRTWEKILSQKGVENIDVIHGGIDLKPYENIKPSDEKTFGRITRWSPGKIPEGWNNMVKQILEAIPQSKCIIYTQLDQAGKREPLKHERMIYDKSCQIDMFKGDYLKNLSVYIHANGTFKETLSFAVIEAMATGLPIVYLRETGVIREVTGGTQIECGDLAEVKGWIIKLLNDKALRESYGSKAKERAKAFDINKMIENFNKEIKECLNRK